MAETTVTRKGDVGQRLAQYAPAVDLATSCGVCAHYQADMCGCEIVAGMINPDYTCRFFQTADPQAEAADELAEAETMPEPGMAGMAMSIEGEFAVAKADPLKGYVFGWANVSIKRDGQQLTDLYLDEIDPDELEASAYEFVKEYGGRPDAGGVDHTNDKPATGKLIESMFMSLDKQEALGVPPGTLPVAWWLGFEVADRDQFMSVVRGERPFFSVQGKAIREEVDE